MNEWTTDKAISKHLRHGRYAKDDDFQRLFKSIFKSMDDVNKFVAALEKGSNRRNQGGCLKLHVFRSWMKHDRFGNFISEFDWAISGLAHARRVHCMCHLTGCFTPRKDGRF